MKPNVKIRQVNELLLRIIRSRTKKYSEEKFLTPLSDIYETERINTPGQKEVNELDYEFLEAERKVDAFFDEKYSEEEFHSTCPLVAQTTIWEVSMC